MLTSICKTGIIAFYFFNADAEAVFLNPCTCISVLFSGKEFDSLPSSLKQSILLLRFVHFIRIQFAVMVLISVGDSVIAATTPFF